MFINKNNNNNNDAAGAGGRAHDMMCLTVLST